MYNKKHNILIVDDEIMVIRSLLRILRKYDFELFYTTKPIEAVEMLNHTSFDLIISDQRMPEMTGLELMMTAYKHQPNAIRILMSGYSDIDVVISAINDGRIYQYITKPWDNEKVVDTVNRAIIYKSDEDEKAEILSENLEKANSWGIVLTKMNNELERKDDNTIKMMLKVISVKDKDLYNHSVCVAETAVKLANILELEKERQELIHCAGLLHDIGKISIRDKIMYKPGSLDADEYEAMKQHPTVGAQILYEVDFLDDVAVMVEQHHERIDGMGYPHKLKHNEILLESQIISVADSFEALIEDRVYRKGMSYEKAFEFISDDTGKRFRFDVVNALKKLILANTD